MQCVVISVTIVTVLSLLPSLPLPPSQHLPAVTLEKRFFPLEQFTVWANSLSPNYKNIGYVKVIKGLGYRGWGGGGGGSRDQKRKFSHFHICCPPLFL